MSSLIQLALWMPDIKNNNISLNFISFFLQNWKLNFLSKYHFGLVSPIPLHLHLSLTGKFKPTKKHKKMQNLCKKNSIIVWKCAKKGKKCRQNQNIFTYVEGRPLHPSLFALLFEDWGDDCGLISHWSDTAKVTPSSIHCTLLSAVTRLMCSVSGKVRLSAQCEMDINRVLSWP